LAGGFAALVLLESFSRFSFAAALATIIGAYCVGSTRRSRRIVGFIIFVVSNVLWILWGWPRAAWGLIFVQFALMALNARGLVKNESAGPPDDAAALR
jgi:hypothetical protein